MLSLEQSNIAFRLLDDLSLLDVLLPELAFGRGVTQPGEWHYYDVFEHNMHALEAMDELLALPGGATSGALGAELWRAFAWRAADIRAYLAEQLSEGRPRSSVVKLAALLHDIAKPQTRIVTPDGKAHFYGHADEGAAMVARIMRRERFSASEVRYVSRLVAEHLRPVQLAQVGEVTTQRALYRFYRALGDGVVGVQHLALADASASRGPRMTSEGWSRHVAYMNSLLVRSKEQADILHAPRLLTGNDVMREFGLAEGPRVGELLEALAEAQATGEVVDRQAALEFVRARLGAA
jgi:poly(A) polymerase